jgi:glucokinase
VKEDRIMPEKFAVGVDLGATNVRVALGNEKRHILARLSERTETKKGPEGISQQIIRMVHSIRYEGFKPEKVKGVGIGSIGPLDLKRGEIVKPANIPLDSIPLVEPIKKALKVPVHLLNDCTTAVTGEKEYGAGRGIRNLVYVTMSTGIGGGIYVDNHLLIGKDGNAHEIGHITIDFEGCLTCGCGKKGHWEAYCSAKNLPNYVQLLLGDMDPKAVDKSGLIKLAKGNRHNITSKMLYDVAKAGDALSMEIVEKAGLLNAIGFANIINAYDPDLITVGGTMALKNTDLIMEPIKRHVHEYTINRVSDIIITPLGDDVVLYGAIAMVHTAEQ